MGNGEWGWGNNYFDPIPHSPLPIPRNPQSADPARPQNHGAISDRHFRALVSV
jgi:hypothetical protein